MILSVRFGFFKVWSENRTELKKNKPNFYIHFFLKKKQTETEKTEPNRIVFGSCSVLPTPS